MPLELGHRARLRVTIQKGNVCLFPGDNVEFCRACLPGTYIFVWRGSALWWINPENWTPRHTKTCASSLMPARHRFFLIFAAWLRREALRTLQQASWGVNLTLPLVYCRIRIACDQLKVVFFFSLPVQGTDTQTMKKLQQWPKHFAVYNFWLLNQIVKGLESVTSRHCF